MVHLKNISLSNIGAIIKQVRTDKQLSASVVAKNAGLYPSQFHRLENGIAEPRVGLVDSVFVALGITVDLHYLEINDTVNSIQNQKHKR